MWYVKVFHLDDIKYPYALTLMRIAIFWPLICWALDACHLGWLLVLTLLWVFLSSTEESVFAGSIVCGNKDGIYQEIFLLCTINWWLCPGSSALDRVWTSLHSLLAPYASLGRGILIARVCCWRVAPAILPGYSKEGTTQRVPEARIDDRTFLCYSVWAAW